MGRVLGVNLEASHHLLALLSLLNILLWGRRGGFVSCHLPPSRSGNGADGHSLYVISTGSGTSLGAIGSLEGGEGSPDPIRS